MKVMAIIFGVIVVVGWFATKTVMSIYANYPDYAQQEVLLPKYQFLLDRIDTLIQNSNSRLDFAARMEKIEYPEETVYVVLKRADNEELEILDRRGSYSLSRTTVINGFGYGNMGDRAITIIRRPVKDFGVEYVDLQFLHTQENG